MKTLLLLLALPLTSLAHGTIPDIPPDASSREYRSLLRQRPPVAEDDGLDEALAAGERNLDWLAHINSLRPEGEKLSFTSKDTQRGVPIDAPNEYSPALILERLRALQATYPPEMASVVFAGAPFTDQPPVALKVYLDSSRLLDRIYQSAARWRTMQSWLPFLESRRRDDIRGYYFLSRLEEREQKLGGFHSLPVEEQGRLREWLSGMCLNASTYPSDCDARVQRAINEKRDLNALYRSFEPHSANLYLSYFRVPAYATRRDFRWETGTDGSSRLIAPFLDPQREDVRHFVQFNIEEEWKFGDWNLALPFRQTEEDIPHIVFVPGATPNVNGLGGSRITMNANQPLTEYDAQWTIRHEFGHVLGLPDCYVEFYVAERGVIVNYQIDVENIMCSRRGRIKEENVRELRRAYTRRI